MSRSSVGRSAGVALEAIVERQKRWARSAGMELGANGWITDRAWITDRDKQFVLGLDAESEARFRQGAGKEFDEKMRAPHSSSALAYNMLAPCTVDQAARDAAEEVFLGTCTGGLSADVTFECKRRTAWAGTPPHLDAEIVWPAGHVVAIESKFSETFSVKGHKRKSLAPYVDGFDAQHPRWMGRTHLHAHALQIHDATTPVYHLLDAPQLIKHALGLLSTPSRSPVTLALLWYDESVLTPEAAPACDLVRRESDAFRCAVGADINLRLASHQDLFAACERHAGSRGWLESLRRRYFSA